MLDYNVMILDAGKGTAREAKIKGVTGAVDAGLRIHEDRASWNYPPLSSGNPLFIGIGPLAGGPLFGSHRLVFVFRSPVSGGIHVSTMGGAAYDFVRTGLDGIVVEGYSKDPAIVLVLGGESGVEVSFEYVEWERLWRIYNGSPRGTRGLHSYIAREVLDERVRRRYRPRIILVGPGAYTTRFAGVFSWLPGPDWAPGPVVDSASRGGGGSVMAQAHGVVAIVFGSVGGGSRFERGRVVDVVSRVLGGNYYRVVEEATRKYRYDPSLDTGGTFGVNYVHYRELIPALAYNTIYYSPAVRLALHEKIMKWFWRPFQERVFVVEKARAWRTCGEPCSVVCKKIWNGVKLDYEPAHGMGPMIGVITLEDAAGLVELVDDLGLDAIEAGHTIAWLYDAVEKGLIKPGEMDLDERPVLDPLALDPATSKVNAVAARRLLERLVERRGEVTSLIALEGAREAARILDEVYEVRVSSSGWRFRDLLVYASFGETGYMTPNYYWSPGMVAPMFLLGRYWTNYSPSYTSPEDYAVHSYSRAIAELSIDNAGLCRFHRRWAEKVLQALYREVLGVDVDLYESSRGLYRRIALYQVRAGAEPKPWESRKTMDLVATIAAEVGYPGWESLVGNYDAILEWWHQFYGKLMDLVGGV